MVCYDIHPTNQYFEITSTGALYGLVDGNIQTPEKVRKNSNMNIKVLLIWTIQITAANKHYYTTAFRSLFRHVVSNGTVSCKTNGVGNQLGRGDTVTY